MTIGKAGIGKIGIGKLGMGAAGIPSSELDGTELFAYDFSQPNIAEAGVELVNRVDTLAVARTSISSTILKDGSVHSYAANKPAFTQGSGVLVQYPATNIVTDSRDFDDWIAAAADTSGTTVTAPDGSTTWMDLIEDTATSGHHINFLSGTITDTRNFDFFAESRGDDRTVIIRTSGQGVSTWAEISLTDGSIVDSATTYLSNIDVEQAGNAYRISGAFDGSTDDFGQLEIGLNNGTVHTTGRPIYTGDGVSGVRVWQADFISDIHPSSPIYAVAATTRTQDTATIDTTGWPLNGFTYEGRYQYRGHESTAAAAFHMTVDANNNFGVYHTGTQTDVDLVLEIGGTTSTYNLTFGENILYGDWITWSYVKSTASGIFTAKLERASDTQTETRTGAVDQGNFFTLPSDFSFAPALSANLINVIVDYFRIK